MQGLLERASVCFAGGVFGGLVAVFGAWLAGRYGWTDALGVAMAPAWEAAWVHSRLIVGGLWGLLFVPSLMTGSLLWRGLFFSLCPTLAQFLIVFPLEPGAGIWGLGLGAWTPLVVAVTNALWGWTTAAWVMAATGEGQPRYRRLR
jgi:hypothetical protein